MHTRLLWSLLFLALFASPLDAKDKSDEKIKDDQSDSKVTDTQATESQATWVTGIAPLSGDTFVASTADGLLLREAAVVSFLGSDVTKQTKLYTHPAAVWCIDTSSNRGLVASVDYRGNLVVYDVKTKEPSLHEKAFERWSQTLRFTADGKFLVAGNEGGKLLVWDVASEKVARSAELGDQAITSIDFSRDGKLVAAADGGGHVTLLQWSDLKVSGKIKVSDDSAWSVAFSDGKLLVGSGDRNLYRCDAKPDAKCESIVKGSDWVTSIAVSPSGQIAASEVSGKLHFPTSGGGDSMEAESGVWALCWKGDNALMAGTRKNGIVVANRSWKWANPK